MGENGLTMEYPAWAHSVDAVLQHHGVDASHGLTDAQVLAQRERYGYNELEKDPPKALWKLVLEQFDDMLVKILLVAAVISFAIAYFEEGSAEEGLRAYVEPFVILAILIINAIVGVWQESNAEAALDALTEMQSEHAVVWRNGKLVSDLLARELVPGDIVEMHTGDRVPADLRVLSLNTATLRAEQASLTGEAVAVQKDPTHLAEEHCELQSKENMLFAATAIANGSGMAVVNSIGMATEIGKIQSQIQEAAKEEDDTPLKKKLDEFGEALAKVIFWICVLVWVINYRYFLFWKTDPETSLPDWSTVHFSLAKCTYYFKIAVALAVAAIPEGLPAVITTCLALGTRKMAKRNAIVRKLPSVETLGCTTVICSDKTGTLTTNQMSVVQLVNVGATPTGDLREHEVEGTTFNPDAGRVVGFKGMDANLEAIAAVCSLCQEAHLECTDGVFKAVGAPTEAALLVLVEKLGVPVPAEQEKILAARRRDPDANPCGAVDYYNSRLQKLATLEFDRKRKSMSVIVRGTGGAAAAQNMLLVKGAAECVVERCSHMMLAGGAVKPLSESLRKQLLASVDSMAEGALRCLALAQKTELGDLAKYDGPQHKAHAQLTEPANYQGIESGLTFLGLCGLMDPPRPEVTDAIAECKDAGIRVIMITGDNKLTAEAVARDIGIFGPETDVSGRSITGLELRKLSLEDRIAFLRGDVDAEGPVISRAEPRDKQDIVRLLKEDGEVVAMTGDGVNDAPALKLADIGIAMGITGTEVAKEASDMVLADDNFSSIVAAVEEGRAIYNNMKAFIRYMISSNIGEVVSIFLTAALGLPEGLIPVQLLWVNLVTDGPPATALGFNPPDVDIMEKPPRRSDEPLITAWIFFRWMLVGCYVGFATVGIFVAWYLYPSVLGLDLSADGHTPVTYSQLSNWEECPTWTGFQANNVTFGGNLIEFSHPCAYFTEGKAKASTLSLSVLVAIEMFNALNALSEDNSLLTMPPWINPWLLAAEAVSFGLHFLILYVPALANIFGIVPLSFQEWLLVILFASPVILIDEVLKFIGRRFVNPVMPSRRTTAELKKLN